MNGKDKIRKLTIIGLMAALLFIMAYTPLGYLKIAFFGLEITFNVIPVAIAAIATGPAGGAVTGAVFGLTSFLQCFGANAMGTALLEINPFLTAAVCFLPRILDGLITGFIANALASRSVPAPIRCSVSGFAAAFLNTLLYMSALILSFGSTDIIMNLREQLAPGKNVFIFVCTMVGINAVVEILVCTAITCAVGVALSKAKLLPGKSDKTNAGAAA